MSKAVLDQLPLRLEYQDLSHPSHHAGAEPGTYIEEFKTRRREQGFDLEKGPLLRTALFKTGASSYRLIWGFHHILMDGWCLSIIYNDLVTFYCHLKHNRDNGKANTRKAWPTGAVTWRGLNRPQAFLRPLPRLKLLKQQGNTGPVRTGCSCRNP